MLGALCTDSSLFAWFDAVTTMLRRSEWIFVYWNTSLEGVRQPKNCPKTRNALFDAQLIFSDYPRRCKTSSVGQSVGLLIPRSSDRFRQKLKKIGNSNLHGFELHRPSSKGNKLLLQVIKAIINQCHVFKIRGWRRQNHKGLLVFVDNEPRFAQS